MRKKLLLGPLDFKRRLFGMMAQPIFLLMILLGPMFLLTGAACLYFFEADVNPKLSLYVDALYWTTSAATSSSYGSAYPVTSGGKIVGIVILLAGSLFYWGYIALFAGIFLTPDLRRMEKGVKSLEDEMTRLEKQLTKKEF